MKTIEELRKLSNDPMINNACIHSFTKKIMEESFINGYKYAMEHQWISVKDALPKLDKDGYSDNVFIHGSGGYVGSAYYADNTFYTWDGADEISGIDYWMPIPKIDK